MKITSNPEQGRYIA